VKKVGTQKAVNRTVSARVVKLLAAWGECFFCAKLHQGFLHIALSGVEYETQ
jgi:hypothetical protein